MSSATPETILAMIAFARVVEARSFTAAARKLGVSKSVVSERVSALERELKLRLLHRTTRKLSLTPDGVALYERCARVASAADDALLAFEGAGDSPRGLLRVNAPIVFAEEYLVDPIAKFLGRFPDVRVELGLNDRPIDLVEEGIDVAVRITARLATPGLVARKIAIDTPVLCAAPAYLARRGTPAGPEELVHHDCMTYSLLKISQEWRFRVAGTKEPLAVAIEPRFSAASGALLRRAALAGLGIAVLPRFMASSDLAAGRLVIALDSLAAPTLGIYAIYPEGRRAPSKVRAFVDTLVAHFKTRRW
ncbi:MAG TPA: LysR family transcriptional regulator [Polyangiaceae bacterium]|nr:LysR family transcriptional regulator [Polyangiaceae bacterium]